MNPLSPNRVVEPMEVNGRTVLVCNCEGTMPLDGAKLAAACGAPSPAAVATHLCRTGLDRFTAALESASKPLIVACTQEAPLFDELREDSAPNTPITAIAPITFVNIRERAGWSDEAAESHPKIAALIAEAALQTAPVSSIELKSEGVALIYGRDELAIEAARQLMDKLDITVLLTQPTAVIPPRTAEFPILKGTIVKATGHLGKFELEVDDYAAPKGPLRKAPAPPRKFAPRGRRLPPPPPVLPPIPDLRPRPPGSQIDLRHHPRPDRRHAAVPGPRQARRLSPPRPRQPGRSPEGDLPVRRPDRGIRQAPLRRLPRRTLCPFPQQEDRLPPLPGCLPDRRHHPQPRPRRHRPVRLRRLRFLRRGLPHGSRHLRPAAPRTPARTPAH